MPPKPPPGALRSNEMLLQELLFLDPYTSPVMVMTTNMVTFKTAYALLIKMVNRRVNMLTKQVMEMAKIAQPTAAPFLKHLSPSLQPGSTAVCMKMPNCSAFEARFPNIMKSIPKVDVIQNWGFL